MNCNFSCSIYNLKIALVFEENKMRIKKIFGLLIALCAFTGFVFADEAKYKELLAKAKDYEAKKMWVYAMGTYWDAILEQPQIAKEAYDSFNRIKDSFVDEHNRPTGKPGPGEYDVFSNYDAWLKLCKEFEIYWNEHSEEIYFVSKISYEQGDVDMKNRTVTYKAKGNVDLTQKFSIISSLIVNSKHYASQTGWIEIPVQWPAVSVFKDSKIIPLVKYIGANNNKQISPKYKSTSSYDTYLNDLHQKTRYIRVSPRDMTVGGNTELDFPPNELKEYYVAAWNNIGAVTDDKWESNVEVTVKLLDEKGKLFGTYTSKLAPDSRNIYFEIKNVSQNEIELFKNKKIKYEVESILTKTKNSTAQVDIPYKPEQEISFIDVKHTSGPVIKLYGDGNDLNYNALNMYDAGEGFSYLFSKGYIGSGVRQLKKLQKNKYNFQSSEFVEVKDAVFIIPLASKKTDSSRNDDFDVHLPFLSNHLDYTLNNDNFIISVQYGYKKGAGITARYLIDDFIYNMNNRFNSEFNLGITNSGELCIFREISDAEKEVAIKAAEEEKARKEAEVAQKESEELFKTKIKDGKVEPFAFYNNRSIKNIIIPKGVTAIERSAFSGCKSLTSVTIPDGVTKIGDSVFSDCKSLKNVTISASVKDIGEDVFWGCESLKEISFTGTKLLWFGLYSSRIKGRVIHCSDGDVDISTYENLTEIKISDGITKIGDDAFCGCELLKNITIPKSVTRICPYAFDGCKSLQSITIPSSVKAIDKCAFRGCDNLKTVNYAGTKDDWKKIEINKKDKSNKELLKAKINFESK